MVIYIDTNIVLDYLLKRSYSSEAEKLLTRVAEDESVEAYISVISVINIAYILQKRGRTIEDVREILKNLLNIVKIDFINSSTLISAIDSTKFKDFEDCIQYEGALAKGADYIITGNKADFLDSVIRVVYAGEFLSNNN